MDPKINDANELIYKTETDRHRKWIFGYQEWRVGVGRIDWEFGIDTYTLIDNQQGPII